MGMRYANSRLLNGTNILSSGKDGVYQWRSPTKNIRAALANVSFNFRIIISRKGCINVWILSNVEWPVFHSAIFAIKVEHSKTKTPFWGTLNTCFGCKNKTRVVFWLLFKIGLCSAISFKRSRRELSIDVAEHRPILKNKGAVRILVIFQYRPMFCHIIQKVSARGFHWCGWT